MENNIKTYLHFNSEGEMLCTTQFEKVQGSEYCVELTDDLLIDGQPSFYEYDIENKKVKTISEKELLVKAYSQEKVMKKLNLKNKTLYNIVDEYPIYKQINILIDQVKILCEKNNIELTKDLTEFVKFRDSKIKELTKEVSTLK